MAMRDWLRHRWQVWLERRLPRLKHIQLTQRNTFIFPGEEGLAFLAVVLLVFIGGINYENSLMLGTSFMLASLFLVTIVATFLNLSGIQLSCPRADAAHVGELAFVELSLDAAKGSRYGVVIRLGDFRATVAVEPGTPVSVKVPFVALRRGKGYPPRILLESRYPFGFVRAWTWLSLDQFAIIFPKPLPCELLAEGESDHGKKQTIKRHEEEEYAGVREYRAGDSLKAVHWKQLAKSGSLYTKVREGSTATTSMLNLHSVPGPGLEARLGQLAYWVDELTRKQIPFGLALPSASLAVGNGPQHWSRAMHLLALYGMGD